MAHTENGKNGCELQQGIFYLYRSRTHDWWVVFLKGKFTLCALSDDCENKEEDLCSLELTQQCPNYLQIAETILDWRHKLEMLTCAQRKAMPEDDVQGFWSIYNPWNVMYCLHQLQICLLQLHHHSLLPTKCPTETGLWLKNLQPQWPATRDNSHHDSWPCFNWWTNFRHCEAIPLLTWL